MAATGISAGGLASGLDTNAIIDGLVGIENNKIIRQENKQKEIELQLSTYGQLKTRLNDLKTTAAEISDVENFDKYNIDSSNEDSLTLKGLDGALEGDYSVKIFQLAKSEKVMSNTYTATNTALGITGSFDVNRTRDAEANDPAGTDITIDIAATDTLSEIADKINSQEDIGLSASILKIGTDEYTLILTSKDEGADGISFTESGFDTILRDMGFLAADGTKGNVTQALEGTTNTTDGATAITENTVFADIFGAGTNINDTITIKGTDHNGNEINASTFVITDPATSKVSDLLKEIEGTFNGMVSATIENGQITITDKATGKSSLSVDITANNEGIGSSLDFGGTFTLKTAGQSNSLQNGKDAYFSIDGINLSANENNTSNVVTGVEIQLKEADIDKEVQVSIKRDYEGVMDNIELLLDRFNTINHFINDATKLNVDDSPTSSSFDSSTTKEDEANGVLASDATARRVMAGLKSVLINTFEEMTGYSFDNLISAGLKSDRLTGDYELDRDVFENNLKTNYSNVKRLFTTNSTTDDSNFMVGRTTSDTKSGRYMIDVDSLQVHKLDPTDNSIVESYAATLSANILTVSEEGSDALGLSITVPATGSSILNFTKGVGKDLSDYIEKNLLDKDNGVISVREDSLDTQIEDIDIRIENLDRRINNYRTKLINEFAALEQRMSTLNTQSSMMLAQMGFQSQ